MQPWAETLFKERAAGLHSNEEPDANCLPQGVPKIDAAPVPWKLIQMPGQVVILYEAFTQFRQIFTGRPQAAGGSESDLAGILDRALGRRHAGGREQRLQRQGVARSSPGIPTTEKLHVTEKFRRKDFGHMEMEITIDDPGAYTKPWTVKESPTLLVDTELLEFVCSENEQDIKHMVTKK